MSFQPPTTTHNSAACAVIALGSNLAHEGESPAQIVIEAAKRLQPLSLQGLEHRQARRATHRVTALEGTGGYGVWVGVGGGLEEEVHSFSSCSWTHALGIL